MRVGMVFPHRSSEKAISSYSSDLVESIKERGVKIEEVTYLAGKPFSLLNQFNNFKKFDIIHIQHEYNLLGGYGIPFFIIYFLLLFSKVKVITTMHTVLSLNENFRGNKLKTILRKILYSTQNKIIKLVSEKIIVHANFSKNILIKEYRFNEKKIKVFPQAIIENVKIIPKEEAKKRLNLKGNVYIFMGSMVPDHGQDIIIKQAKKIGPTILIVANPKAVNDRNKKRISSFLNENIEYVKKNRLKKIVRFDILNINDKKPLWWLYFSSADFVLLPYRGGICSGIFTHAMAAEIPVIASDIPFFREISRKFGCVKIVKKESEYSKIIKENIKPEKMKRMIKECKRYKREYGLKKSADKYKEFYKRL